MHFPLELLHLVRCTRDGAPLLAPAGPVREFAGGWGILHGHVHCTACGHEFPVREGILDMMGDAAPEGEAAHEQALRDEHAARLDPTTTWYDNEHHRMEMGPTLDAVDVTPDCTVLELGAGDGRYTTRLAGSCHALIAADFSRKSLQVLGARLAGQPAVVGRVLADVTTLKVKRNAFDRVFSTLTSNLPTAEHRDALYRLASHAVRRRGRFIFSAHYHGVRERLRGEPKAGYYKNGGIFRYNFTLGDCHRETGRHFADVHARPIHVYLPLAGKLGIPGVVQSRLGERLPVLRHWGMIVICTATHDALRRTRRLVRRFAAAVTAVGAAAFMYAQLDWD